MRIPMRGLRRVVLAGALALSVAIAIAANASAANTVSVPGTASFWANGGNGGTPSIPGGISVAGATTVNISVDNGFESPFPGAQNYPNSAVFLGRWFTAAHTPIALPADYPLRLNGGPLGDPIGDNSIFNPIGNTLAGNATGGFGTPGPYSAVITVPAGAATIEFAWYDSGYADNSGAAAVTVDPVLAGPINTTLNVPAAGTNGHDYTDTGITLTAGQTVTVTASGIWDICGGACPTGPNGSSFFDSTLRSGSSAGGSLIGSVDGGATWFLVGAGPATVTGPGTLWLSSNDYLWGYYDESGSLSATIVEGVVTPPDTTPPVVTAVSNIPQVEATGPAGAVVTYVAPTANDDVDGSVPVVCVLPSGSTFAIGLSTVVCTATDSAGNSASTSFTVSVGDSVRPLVSVPAAITREATGPAGATASFTASANDVVDGLLPATCVPASGSVFPIGSTTVTCSATDAAGNSGSSSFTVTVGDTTGPAVTVALVNTKKGGDDDSEQSFRVVITSSDAVGVTGLTATLNGVTVTNGQIVKLKKTKKGAQKVKREDGKLQIEATSFLLSATARDAAGNATTATAVPSFNDKGKNDDDGDDKKGGKKDD